MPENSLQDRIHRVKNRKNALSYATGRTAAIAENLQVADNRFSFFRFVLVVSLIGFLSWYIPKGNPVEGFLAICGALFAFVFLSLVHRKIKNRLQFWKTAAQSYRYSRAICSRSYNGFKGSLPPWHDTVARTVPRGHVWASDLDMVESIFPLLNTCTTQEGSQKLLHLMLGKEHDRFHRGRADRAFALSKRPKLLRKIYVESLLEDVRESWLQAKSMGQDSRKNVTSHAAIYNAKSTLVFLGTALVGILAWGFMLAPALATFFQDENGRALFQHLFKFMLIPLVSVAIFVPLIGHARNISRKVHFLKALLKVLNDYKDHPSFKSFVSHEKSAVTHIKKLQLPLDLATTLRSNPVFWLFIHLLLPFDALVSIWLWVRLRPVSENIKSWWEEAVEFDVCLAVARFADNNPTARFQTLEERQPNHTSLEFADIMHPSLAPEESVPNSIVMPKESPMVLLTGSNMSGKSTFLRTLGVNIVLANMGAPVFAQRLVVPDNLDLYCAIRIDDSLSDATSYFYAEVKRLKVIVEALRDRDLTQRPVLFLVDEIFRGTNNKERFIGSWHILKNFLEQGAFGVVSTHDLALAELEKNDKRLVNMHFKEDIVDGELEFNYKLLKGPSPTTNALFIMRREGLPVPKGVEEEVPVGNQVKAL